MKKVLYILFAAVAMATACTREAVPEQQSVLTTTVAPKEGDLMRVTFTVTVPETDLFATQTRAPFGEQPNIGAGDVYVAVFGAGESDGVGGSLQNFLKARILYDPATYLEPPIRHNEHDPYQSTPTGTGSFKYKYEVLMPLSNDPLVLDFLVGACDSQGVPYTLDHPLPVGYEREVMPQVYAMGEQAGYWQRKRISGVFPKIVNGEYKMTEYTSDGQVLPIQDQDYIADDIAELQEVKLIRNFAKITYKSSADAPFTIHSFILVDTPKTSALAPYSSTTGYNTAYTTASDAGVIMSAYRGYVLSHELNSGIEGKTFITASSGDPRNSYGYMYERTIPTNSDPAFAESGAILYVTWNDLSWVTNTELYNSLNSNPNRYYKVSFVDNNGYVPILRNIEYRFEVSSIVADTHPTTAAEAYAGAFLGDVSANITTSMLDDISNNKSRIVIGGRDGNHMSYTAIGADNSFDIDFYFYPVSGNDEVVVTNGKASTAANGAMVTITKDVETVGSYTQAIRTTSNIRVTSNTDGTDNHGTITVSLEDSEAGVVKKGKLKILGQVEGFRPLYREIEFTVMEKQEFEAGDIQASASPLGSDAMNQATTVTIVLPDGLPRDIFPLQIKIEARNNALTSIPDNTVTPAISALPVKYGPSAFGGSKYNYYFVKTITFDDYATLSGTSYVYTNEFPCKFKTRLSSGNATTIKINDLKEEFFVEKTLTLSVQ
ncbi:MAG: hypothetical protein IJ896_02485 [Fibrobacter sp.]|nr:hypothetical protein [Fibrobacter sp.]